MPFYGYSSFDLFYLPSFVGTECNSALTIVYIRAFGYPSDRGAQMPKSVGYNIAIAFIIPIVFGIGS